METLETKSQYERERSRESKESKEAELSPEAQVAASMERAEIIVKEVKSNKQQMQNILMHMGQVQKAIKDLRKQLALEDSGDAASVSQDAEAVARLKKQIAEYREEILAMQDDLLRAQLSELAETQPDLSASEREQMARSTVDQMIAAVHDA